MGSVDIKKQAPNVARMKILGARVIEVTDGLATLKEAVDAAFAAYSREYKDAIYCIGSVVGPHPFPMMVRDFQSVVGIEAREQFLQMTGELPDAVVACVGGGSNAMGIFSGFLNDPVEIYGVEPLGRGTDLGDHAPACSTATKESCTASTASCSRMKTVSRLRSTRSQAVWTTHPADRTRLPARFGQGEIRCHRRRRHHRRLLQAVAHGGIIPAIESSHAVAYALKLAEKMGKAPSSSTSPAEVTRIWTM